MKNIVVNLFAGPGCGKSSTCAGVFSWLKWHDVDCEMATEYAKDKVWEGSTKVLRNQIYIFGKQHHRIFRLRDKVDVVVTDSPLLFTLIYDSNCNDLLRQLAIQEFRKCNNINILLQRKKKYNPNGRLQTEDQARDIDRRIEFILKELGEEYVTMEGRPETVPIIGQKVLDILNEETEFMKQL